MQKHVCDHCGKEMGEGYLRYEARIEAGPAFTDAELGLDGIDFNSGESLTEMMDRLDREAKEDALGGAYHFDLCENCYRTFLESPLLKMARSRDAHQGYRR